MDAANTSNDDFQKAPLLALFDNSLFLRDEPKEGGPSVPGATQLGLFSVSRHAASSRARQNKMAQELRDIFPPWEVTQAMLDYGGSSLSIWKVLVSESTDFMGLTNVQEDLRRMSKSNQPTEVCKALCVLALIMQQTPEEASLTNPLILSGINQANLLQKSLQAVETLLCSGSTMIGSLEGLECAAIFCRILFNAGRPRKAWLFYEKALSYARMLGFHRASSWKTDKNPSIGRRRQQVWWHLFIGNRSLSLLLGLPYSVLEAHLGLDPDLLNGPVTPSQSVMIQFSSFYLRLGIITGRIIDRNYSNISSTASLYAETMKIDGELHALEVGMPRKWLALCDEEGDLSEFMDMGVQEMFEASNSQIWHHECRIALHMPYMMMNTQYSQEAGKYEYSRMVAIKSARSLIRSHLRLRAHPDLCNLVCQVVDFQVFMATVLLILDLLSRCKGPSGPRLLSEDADCLKDQQLIRSAYSMLARLATQNIHKSNIPLQSTKVLDTLAYLVKGQSVPGVEHNNQRIVIPYFGAITIKASSALVEGGKGIKAHMKGECPTALSDPQQPICNFKSFTPPDEDVIKNQANDFTFQSFVTPQPSTAAASLSQSPGLIAPVTTNLGYENPEFGGFSSQAAMDIDAQMWDQSMWQDMLTQDPLLDLDVDWNILPVEEGK